VISARRRSVTAWTRTWPFSLRLNRISRRSPRSCRRCTSPLRISRSHIRVAVGGSRRSLRPGRPGSEAHGCQHDKGAVLRERHFLGHVAERACRHGYENTTCAQHRINDGVTADLGCHHLGRHILMIVVANYLTFRAPGREPRCLRECAGRSRGHSWSSPNLRLLQQGTLCVGIQWR